MDMNPYKSPSMEAANDQGKWFRRRLTTAQKKQRAIRAIVAINCGLIAYVLGGLALYQGANSVHSVVEGNGWIWTDSMMRLLMDPYAKFAVGILGGFIGYALARRFLTHSKNVAWKLSLAGGLSVGITTLVVVWHDAKFLTGAIGLTVAWAAIPHLLKWKKII